MRSLLLRGLGLTSKRRMPSWATAVALAAVAGCVNYDPTEPFVCRADDECGPDFTCVRGVGCYCVCVQGTPETEAGNPAAGTPPLWNSVCNDGPCTNPDGAQ